MSHHPVTNITTTPQGWPACTETRRYSNIYNICPAFSSKAPLGCFVDLYPPFESIIGEDKELSRRGGEDDDETDDFMVNTSSNPSFSFSETWDQLPLS
jgi:hypothetical protein